MKNKKVVAFVTMEVLIDKLPTYAGGLGILAGDFIESAADLNIPIVLVSLVHRKGYVEHRIEGENIVDLEEDYEPLEYFDLYPKTFELELKDVKIFYNVWIKNVKSNKIILLDTYLPENDKALRNLTNRLYIEQNIEERILKELLLGIGTIDVLKEMGYDVRKYHINETHGGFLAIELYKRFKDIGKVKEKIVFTTHTPLPHGHERFPYQLVEKYYDIPVEIKKISPDQLNLSRVLFKLSEKSNTVSWKHYFVTKNLIPYSNPTLYITNGVYHKRWIHNRLKELFNKYLGNWDMEPELLANVKVIPYEEFVNVKKEIKRELVEYVNTNSYQNKEFGEEDIIITARRRITGYKRIDLIFRDIEKLENLGRSYKIAILVSGVTHPMDIEGKKVIMEIYDLMSTLSHTKVALILRRGVELEKYIISGSDIFLHTPKPPYEACGTSWMRASMNGVPVLASRDGGVIEVIVDDYNGWLFGPNAYSDYDDSKDHLAFYKKLEHILNLIRNSYWRYVDISMNAIKTVGPIFNSYRMVREYNSLLY